ncbi:helix-turn-helix domain-containing protein [Dongia rigui]|uniref:Helix-turn-helix domain-containing protein n=1 Tax=Dongia rigui TaxID=940149 RepID=A0ABU5DVR5_9PROT|nr:helix-turn-helix domain-containing protein [Dongia rigui]MDY0871406.1 helix-turn-helix domain-containing protein [Dongia rigui]
MQLDATTIHSSDHLPGARQYDWWRDAVSATHLPWDLPRRLEGDYRARFRQQAIGQAQIVHCACDPCEGRRGKAEIAQLQQPLFGILYVLKGREKLTQGGREIMLEQGSFTLWDSTRPIAFGLPQDLEKITLLLPHELVAERLPQAEDLVLRPVSGRRGPGALFATHLRALAREGAALPLSGTAPILRATLDLLATSLSAVEDDADGGYHRAMRRRIQDFILQNLADPDLRPDDIARAAGISERQLHRLFQSGGHTVERWIWQQRLQRCRDDLLARPTARISEIAFAHGFSDAAHFSRSFRDMFGVSPRQFRKTAN